MRKSLIALLLASAFLLSSHTAVHTVKLNLDQAASSINWVGYAETGGFAPEGSIQAKSGHAVFDHGRVVGGEFVVDMSTIEYSDKKLQEHLKNEDFFHVKKFPEAKFKITKMEGTKITGDLTIRGKTNSISFDALIKPVERTLRVSGTMIVDRTKFDIKYNSSDFFQDLGSYAIKNNFDLKFDLVFK